MTLPLVELEALRVALSHWRAHLYARGCVPSVNTLLLRHGAVLRGAAEGGEVPRSELSASAAYPFGHL